MSVSSASRAGSSRTRASSVNSGRSSGTGSDGSRHNPSGSSSGGAASQPSRSSRASSAVAVSASATSASTVPTRSCDGAPTPRRAFRTSRLTPFSLRTRTSRARVVRSSSPSPSASRHSVKSFTTVLSAFGRPASRRGRSAVSRSSRSSARSQCTTACWAVGRSPRSTTRSSASSRAGSFVGSRSRRVIAFSRMSDSSLPRPGKVRAFGDAQACRKCSCQRVPGVGSELSLAQLAQ